MRVNPLASVEYHLTREGEQFLKNLDDLNKLAVYVGFTEESGAYDDGLTVAQVAAFNEFGTSTIPARPFMQDTVNQNYDLIVDTMKQAMAMVQNGTDAKTILNRIGVDAVGLMQAQIESGQYAPNAPSTIRQKTKNGKVGDHPLIDTGRMWQNIHYVIR